MGQGRQEKRGARWKRKVIGNRFPLHYIGFLPAADVVDAEALDTEALLRLVEAPQPLAPHGPSLALPALATPETTRRGERGKEQTKVDGGGGAQVSIGSSPAVTCLLTHRPSRTHQPQ